MQRKLPYGANYIGLGHTPELREALESRILFRYGASAPSISDALESAACSRFGVGGALAVPNGTQALRLALLSTRPSVGQRVHIPAMAFVAVAGAVLSLGLIPVCVDVDERLALDATLLPADASRVIVAHMDGMVAPVPDLDGWVIEDSAQAMGGRHPDGRSVGSIGHAGIFSFHHAKVLASGEGGLVVCRDRSARDLIRSYSDHGSDREQGKYPTWNAGAYYGENLASNELVASVQLQQLRVLDHILARLERQYARLVDVLSSQVESTVVRRAPGDPKVSVHVVLDSPDRRDHVLAMLERSGLPGWSLDKYLLPRHPVLTSKASIYGDGYPWSLDPDVEHLSRDAFQATRNRIAQRIVLPLAPELTDDEQDEMNDAIVAVLTEAAA